MTFSSRILRIMRFHLVKLLRGESGESDWKLYIFTSSAIKSCSTAIIPLNCKRLPNEVVNFVKRDIFISSTKFSLIFLFDTHFQKYRTQNSCSPFSITHMLSTLVRKRLKRQKTTKFYFKNDLECAKIWVFVERKKKQNEKNEGEYWLKEKEWDGSELKIILKTISRCMLFRAVIHSHVHFEMFECKTDVSHRHPSVS